MIEEPQTHGKTPSQAGESGLVASCAKGSPRDRAELLGAMIDNSTRVIYLKDREGRYLLVNRQYETLFHLTCEEIAGKTDHDLFPRETADAFRANDLEVLAAGAPLEFEESVPQDDGLHTYLSNKFPLRDAAGLPYAVCGISADITDRKRSEEIEARQRERAETWLDRLIETTQDAVVSIDHQGRVVGFNPSAERIFGYTRAEAEGQNVSLLMAEPYASEHES
jgi:PAS domain S-box-containing protein